MFLCNLGFYKRSLGALGEDEASQRAFCLLHCYFLRRWDESLQQWTDVVDLLIAFSDHRSALTLRCHVKGAIFSCMAYVTLSGVLAASFCHPDTCDICICAIDAILDSKAGKIFI